MSASVSQGEARRAAAAEIHKCRVIAARNLRTKSENQSQGLPARTWSAIAIQTRTTLVMLAASAPGDPRFLARQPWGSFTEADRLSIAAVARELSRELRQSASLF